MTILLHKLFTARIFELLPLNWVRGLVIRPVLAEIVVIIAALNSCTLAFDFFFKYLPSELKDNHNPLLMRETFPLLFPFVPNTPVPIVDSNAFFGSFSVNAEFVSPETFPAR